MAAPRISSRTPDNRDEVARILAAPEWIGVDAGGDAAHAGWPPEDLAGRHHRAKAGAICWWAARGGAARSGAGRLALRPDGSLGAGGLFSRRRWRPPGRCFRPDLYDAALGAPKAPSQADSGRCWAPLTVRYSTPPISPRILHRWPSSVGSPNNDSAFSTGLPNYCASRNK